MKKEETTVTWKIAFTKEEIGLMRVALMYTSFEPNQHWQASLYYPAKEDELTSMLTFNEFKKSFKENEKWVEEITDCELELWTEQKALLLKRLDEFKFAVWDLENKFAIIEKLK